MIIISCYTGTDDTRINLAPSKKSIHLTSFSIPCYFFSNNINLKQKAEKMGWNFIFLKNLELTDDFRMSTIQSKYIKFLQFDKSEFNIEKENEILYFDHKYFMTSHHVNEIINRTDLDVLSRYVPIRKKTIFHEIEDSARQPRYVESMPETIKWIRQKINEGYDANIRPTNLGIIYYKNYLNVKKLCDEAYETCTALKQPQDQIVWSILSQKYNNFINKINYEDFSISKWLRK